MTLTDYMCQEEREEEDLPALKTALTPQYNDNKDYIEKRRRRLITATRNNTNDTRISRTTITRKQKWEDKQLNKSFKRQTNDISNKIICTWLRKRNLKKETESLQIAAQNDKVYQTTKHIKACIDKT